MKKKLSKFLYVLSVLFVLLVLFLKLTTRPTQAAWFDDTYAYRLPITFTHNSAISTETYVSVTIANTNTLVSADKMQSDCDDTRFTDSNGKPYRYQLVSGCNSASTIYYVAFPSDAIGNYKTLFYVYYGNPSAFSGSDSSVSSLSQTSPSGGAAASGSEAQSPAPVSYWNFDEGYGSTANDFYSQQNNDLTITNAVWKTSDLCVFGNCLFFDGNADRASKVYSTDTELLPGTSSFTVSSWFKHSSTIGADTMISRIDAVNGVGWKTYMDNSGFICFGIDSSAGSFPSDSACTTTSYADSRWHQVVGVKSTTSSITLFIDGKQVAQDVSITSGSIDGTNTPFKVGNDFDDGTEGWVGFLDEFKYYNFAKTANQVLSEFNSKSQTKASSATFGSESATNSLSNGLIGYWKLDEVSGNAVDSSSNALTLTNNGTTTFTSAKFANGSYHNGTSQYFNTATAISGVLTVAFWVNPASSSDNYINLASGIYINSSSGTLSATGTTSPSIYVNGVLNGTLTTSVWNHIVVTTNTAIAANSFEVGRANNTYLSNGGKMDEIRLYNRTFSKDEIVSLHITTIPPIAYWKMDENSGSSIYDTTGGNTSIGTLTNGPKWTTAKIGSGLRFDNIDDYISVPNNTNLMLSGDITIDMWIYWDKQDSGTGVHDFLLEKGLNDVDNYSFFIEVDTGKLNFEYRDSNSDTYHNYFESTGSVISGKWQHIAVVFSDTDDQVRFYNNGKLTYTETNVTTSLNSTYTDGILIGKQNSVTYPDYFSGQMDDIKIYNYSRTGKQVLEDMNGGHPTIGTPVGSYVGYWTFDESQGTTANDKSVNSNSLTLSTASWTLSGKYGAAWNGTGTNPYLSRSDDPDFDFGTNEDFTLSIWAKSDATGNPAGSEFLIDKHLATNNAGYRLYFNTSGQIVCDIDDDTTGYPEDSATTATDYYDNTWHHIICIRDITAGRLNLYIDGKLDAGSDTSLSATGDLSNTESLYIGAQNATDGGTDDFSGDIDELKIYRAALTQTDVKIEYNHSANTVFGTTGTTSLGAADSSQSREFCVPGDSASCSDPIAWWKLDDNTGTTPTDSSGNNQSGTFTGTPLWAVGKYGSALNFNGSNQAVTATITDPAFSNTIQAWIYPTGSAASKVIITSGKLATDASSRPTYGNCVGTTLSLNTWTHISAISDGSGTCTIYQNGIMTATNTTGITFGTSINIAASSFSGSIDDVKIYNYARTQAQVSWDYNHGKPIAWYKFDECQGPTTYDTSDNGNHGTINGTSSGAHTAIGECTTSGTIRGDGAIGKYNNSLSFDGVDDYISAPDSTTLRPNNGDWSVSIWANPSNSDQISPLITKRGPGPDYQQFSMYIASNINFYADTSGQNLIVFMRENGTNYRVSVTTLDIADGNWHNYVMVADKTANLVYVYVDGKLQQANLDNGGTWPNITNTDSMRIANDNASFFYNGQEDDIKIFNYRLTSSQVKTLYNENSAIRFGPQSGSP